MMVGRTIYEATPEVPENPSQEVVLEVKNLNRGNVIKDVSFKLKKARSWALPGWWAPGAPRWRARFSAQTRSIRGEIYVAGQARCTSAAPAMPCSTASAICPKIASATAWRWAWMWKPTSCWRRSRSFMGCLGWVNQAADARHGQAVRRDAGDQDAQPAAEGQEPLGRQPAEGRHRQMADRRYQHPDLRRADARHRRGRQERDLPVCSTTWRSRARRSS